MQVGVTFPQSEIGTDPDVIRGYAQAAEDLGHEHLPAPRTVSSLRRERSASPLENACNLSPRASQSSHCPYL